MMMGVQAFRPRHIPPEQATKEGGSTCGTEAGSYLRRIDSCITQLKAQGGGDLAALVRIEASVDVGPDAPRQAQLLVVLRRN